MVHAMSWQLEEWANDPLVHNVIVVGSGHRGLCSGGDIKKVRDILIDTSASPHEAIGFWTAEYALDALTATYPKPYIPIMDGVTMGGGAGISAHGALRIATHTTAFAMPETIIGFFPDVGLMHELGAMPGELGMYLALTGATINGGDAVRLNVADHLIPHDLLDQALTHAGEADLEALRALCRIDDTPASPSVREHLAWIDACFVGDDVTAMISALRHRPEPEAGAAADALTARSPWALTVTAHALRRAQRAEDLQAVLRQDAYLARHFMEHPDFVEGVRARLVDKGSQPQWLHATPADVPDAELMNLFAGGPLP
ncbi:ABC transporter ATP-binding protein [Platysternon megacephalum]|uniref:3-hydroxyisobutyryl-CoA hydrolase n=1 Tax=Platysternon megacephalum TaxID=55544 RepID=A0A4D9DHE9_9SAUR|nr:ABC transporter ATP-binding protein [Platysternon megacephalum]